MPPVNILAYSLETVVAEKFQAMIELSEANSRMKDFYDLYQILGSGRLNEELLNKAIVATFENRHTLFTETHPLFEQEFAKNPKFQMLWKNFLKKINQQGMNLSFETVVMRIQRGLSPYWLKIGEHQPNN